MYYEGYFFPVKVQIFYFSISENFNKIISHGKKFWKNSPIQLGFVYNIWTLSKSPYKEIYALVFIDINILTLHM